MIVKLKNKIMTQPQPSPTKIIKTSRQWMLDTRDLLKALLVAAISPVAPIVLQSMVAKQWVFDWTTIWHTAVYAAVAYLIKNFITPSQLVQPANPVAK
jgi:hypothetical protein